MPKTSTESVRFALNGATMGTRWSALFYAPAGFDAEGARVILQSVVDEIDTQMSTWRSDSDLMRLNRAPLGEATRMPTMLINVLKLGLAVGMASNGAFDMAVGDAFSAWGFGPVGATEDSIRQAMAVRRVPAHEAISIGLGTVTKCVPVTLDLNGIAKGFGVDRLAEALSQLGVCDALVGIDGEMRAMGRGQGGKAWTVAVEMPDYDRRVPHSMLALEDYAVATSGDYRNWIDVRGRRFSHTIDPSRAAPLMDAPASVTVLGPSAAVADAWATALMVLGPDRGAALARRVGLDALFLLRGEGDTIQPYRVGRVFEGMVRIGAARD